MSTTRDYASTAHAWAVTLKHPYDAVLQSAAHVAAQQVQPIMVRRYHPLAHAYVFGFGDIA